MRILGIDTASAVASVALLEDGRLVADATSQGNFGISDNAEVFGRGNHAEILIPLVQSVLAKVGLRTADLSGIAVSIGPGSFTGLRIGLATAKGLAYQSGLPIVGVSTLWAHAAGVSESEDTICALVDARKNEVYFALFRRAGEQLERVAEDALGSIAGAIDRVKSRDGASPRSLLFVGDGAKVYESRLRDAFGGVARFGEETGRRTLAAQVAMLAESRFRARMTDDIAELVPVYVRPSEAEVKRGEHAVSY